MQKAERKGTQYTVLHTVKARADKELQERATFYYPIWHGQAPRIISTFLESYDFSGKTIVPFCTSHSSEIGSSADNLHDLCSDSANWREGKRFETRTSKEVLEEWLGNLGIKQFKFRTRQAYLALKGQFALCGLAFLLSLVEICQERDRKIFEDFLQNLSDLRLQKMFWYNEEVKKLATLKSR